MHCNVLGSEVLVNLQLASQLFETTKVEVVRVEYCKIRELHNTQVSYFSLFTKLVLVYLVTSEIPTLQSYNSYFYFILKI